MKAVDGASDLSKLAQSGSLTSTLYSGAISTGQGFLNKGKDIAANVVEVLGDVIERNAEKVTMKAQKHNPLSAVNQLRATAHTGNLRTHLNESDKKAETGEKENSNSLEHPADYNEDTRREEKRIFETPAEKEVQNVATEATTDKNIIEEPATIEYQKESRAVNSFPDATYGGSENQIIE